MKTSRLLGATAAAAATAALTAQAWTLGRSPASAALLPDALGPRQEAARQDLVTWDERSLFIRGERVFLFSGEVHPFRLPVPSLWLDVFQKVRALGLNCVSFYVDWALLEGKAGDFTADGVFALEPFFEAAQQAGIYLIARPGPYINAEVSGGGFPGWLQRVRAVLRAATPEFLRTTDHYMEQVCRIIAAAQITNGGPVILFQPENEYTVAEDFMQFPDGQYMQYVEDQARAAGITVPLISNDARNGGRNAPGTGPGEVDIYGHDGYPLGFNCASPETWPPDALPTTWRADHLAQSPSTPFSLLEFQAGAFDPWGGWGFERCSSLVNHEFERVFYKNNLAAGVSIFNLYMIFGGTNWGNLGHPGGYTSYDYGSPIAEDRTITREKYSELKLIAHFVQASPGLLLADAGSNTTTTYSDNRDITVTPLLANGTGSFFVVRHSNYSSLETTDYRVKIPSSRGTLGVPAAGAPLTLYGRDSKIMVTDYDVQGTNLLYSTADVFTNLKVSGRSVLILYAGQGEYNEFAIAGSAADVEALEDGSRTQTVDSGPADYAAVGWWASSKRTILRIGDVDVYLLDRNSAYNYWVTSLANTNSSIIVNGPYLVRNASLSSDGKIDLRVDLNASTAIEIIGAPDAASGVAVNGADYGDFEATAAGSLRRGVTLPPLGDLRLPSLADLDWRYVDSLPEAAGAGFDDSAWPAADLPYSNNSRQLLVNTASLYGSDYGFHAGALVYRGRFEAGGDEAAFSLWAQGGSGFASQVWLDGEALGAASSSNGSSAYSRETYNFTRGFEPGSSHVLTVLVDNMGLDEQYTPGENTMQEPRGIVGWRLSTSKASTTPVAWKLTGNLGGESYRDRARGPLNEGGLYAERQGYHLPYPPSEAWEPRSPLRRSGEEGDSGKGSGVAFYSAPLDLDLPAGEWDVPLAFEFANDTDTDAAAGGSYRAQLWVNGWQFGKLSSSLGPQTRFPVPEGILDYAGRNWVALAVWSLGGPGAEAGEAVLPGLELVAGNPVWAGRRAVTKVESPAWEPREGAY